MCESYYDVSPYSFLGNNFINNIDPDGRDYWSTNDPGLISQFMNTLCSNWSTSNKSYFITSDLTKWNHLTDSEFASGLSFNDETQKFYLSYFTIENGELNVVGRTFQGFLSGSNANYTLLKYPASGRLNNVYPEFDLMAFGLKDGLFAIAHNILGLDIPRINIKGSNSYNSNFRGGHGKGERNHTKSASGTNNPTKHMRPDPKKPGFVLEKNTQTGKWISKKLE